MSKLSFALPLALAAGLLIAAPASAANWSNPRSVNAEIRQLDRQIDRATGLTRREEARLASRVDRLQSLYRSYLRGGINRNEMRSLENQLNSIKADLRTQSRDRRGSGAYKSNTYNSDGKHRRDH